MTDFLPSTRASNGLPVEKNARTHIQRLVGRIQSHKAKREHWLEVLANTPNDAIALRFVEHHNRMIESFKAKREQVRAQLELRGKTC